MVELEGGQTAFASRHGIEHTTINAILSARSLVGRDFGPHAVDLRLDTPILFGLSLHRQRP